MGLEQRIGESDIPSVSSVPDLHVPLEKPNQRGRPISRETKLGRLISDRGYRAYSIAANANISPRILTEYCGGRRTFTQQHILSLCRVLSVTPDQILEDVDDEYEDEVTELTSTDTSTGGIHSTKSVKDLQREQESRLGPRVSRLRRKTP